MPSREDILNKSLLLLKENNYRGTIVLIMGTGKSILIQNVIKELQPKRVLISTPRNMLNESVSFASMIIAFIIIHLAVGKFNNSRNINHWIA